MHQSEQHVSGWVQGYASRCSVGSAALGASVLLSHVPTTAEREAYCEQRRPRRRFTRSDTLERDWEICRVGCQVRCSVSSGTQHQHRVRPTRWIHSNDFSIRPRIWATFDYRMFPCTFSVSACTPLPGTSTSTMRLCFPKYLLSCAMHTGVYNSACAGSDGSGFHLIPTECTRLLVFPSDVSAEIQVLRNIFRRSTIERSISCTF